MQLVDGKEGGGGGGVWEDCGNKSFGSSNIWVDLNCIASCRYGAFLRSK